jgi:hypothetical protein
MGKTGRQATSLAKQAAARASGRRGGRPEAADAGQSDAVKSVHVEFLLKCVEPVRVAAAVFSSHTVCLRREEPFLTN